jgi:hypothetical protein
MMKKMLLALFGLVLGFALVAPSKASAQVSIGVGVGLPGYAVVQPNPYYVAPAYYRHEGWRDDHRNWRDERHHDSYREDSHHDDGWRDWRR